MRNCEFVNITGAWKNESEPHEVYLIVWPDSKRRDALQQLGRWASNPDLSFTWYDAAKASSNIAEATRDNYTGV